MHISCTQHVVDLVVNTTKHDVGRAAITDQRESASTLHLVACHPKRDAFGRVMLARRSTISFAFWDIGVVTAFWNVLFQCPNFQFVRAGIVWDVSADRKRCLVPVPVVEGAQTLITVVLNWTDKNALPLDVELRPGARSPTR